MEKMDVNIIELLEYLQDLVENSSKVPMSGKVMVDKREIIEVIDQIINYMPDQFKKAEWVMNERERILNEAKKEYEMLIEGGILVTKIDTMETIYEGYEDIKLTKSKKYGNTTVCYYKYEEK